MISKFLELKKEKQDAILNAALNEFAKKGYKHASTNQIVKNARISKGLLFHYFNNKKDLYLFLYDYFFDMFLEKLNLEVNWEERDIFIRNRQMASLKIELFQKYPEMFNFLNSVFSEGDKDIRHELNRRSEKFMNSRYKEMLSDIDVTKFKKGLDIEKTIEIISWAMQGFAYKQQEKLKGLTLHEMNLEESLTELDEYIEILKKSLYKEDYF